MGKVKCGRCKGWGMITVVVGTGCFGPIRRTVRCPHCHGSKKERSPTPPRAATEEREATDSACSQELER